MRVVAQSDLIDEVHRRGGAVYVWPRRLRCCGGSVVLEAATDPNGREFQVAAEEPVRVFVTVGMIMPETLHLELDRRSRIRAFWNGLAWIA